MDKSNPDTSMTVREAGRRGGQAVREKYGPEFYTSIGQKGGEARKRQLGPEGYVELGQKGGSAISQDREHMSKIGKKGGAAMASRRRKAAEEP